MLSSSLDLDDLLLGEDSPLFRLVARHGLHTLSNITVLFALASAFWALFSHSNRGCLLSRPFHQEAILLFWT